jgi:hypothetical protein
MRRLWRKALWLQFQLLLYPNPFLPLRQKNIHFRASVAGKKMKESE